MKLQPTLDTVQYQVLKVITIVKYYSIVMEVLEEEEV